MENPVSDDMVAIRMLAEAEKALVDHVEFINCLGYFPTHEMWETDSSLHRECLMLKRYVENPCGLLRADEHAEVSRWILERVRAKEYQ